MPPADVTVTFNATVWPKLEGLGVVTTVVVVAALPTVWVTTVEVEAAKSTEPE